MLGRDADRAWEELARKGAHYWGGINLDQFRQDELDETHLSEFFQSGRDHIEYILDTIRAHIWPGFSPSRALDFGCGVGRCAIPLASVCPAVVGVDVSDTILEQARSNSMRQGLTNLTWLKSTDDLSNVTGDFDLIYSSFVLQHIPPKRGEKIFRKLIGLLSDNGVGALDLLIHRDIPTFLKTLGRLRKTVPFFNNIANLLHGQPFSQPLVEKNVYDLNRVFTILHETGCGNLHSRLFKSANQLQVILFFQKRRDPTVPHEFFYNS